MASLPTYTFSKNFRCPKKVPNLSKKPKKNEFEYFT